MIGYLGRNVLHVCRDRNFDKSYRRTKDGSTVPLMWRMDSEELGKFQYAMLTDKQYSAERQSPVLVADWTPSMPTSPAHRRTWNF